MTPTVIIDALRLPAEARVDQRVPKKLLLEQGAPTTGDKRRIQEGVEELTWVATLKPTSVGVAAGQDPERPVLEVPVLTIALKAVAKPERLIECVHRAIPYPIVLIVEQEGRVALSLAAKRVAANEPGKMVLDEDVTTTAPLDNADDRVRAEFLQSLALNRLPSQNLDLLYQGLLDRAIALAAAPLVGAFRTAHAPAAAAHRIEALRTHTRITREIAALRKAAARESQLARRAELNITLQRLAAEQAECLAVLGRPSHVSENLTA